MPKILWMSPYSLHDTSSGASVDAKLMLENMQRRGWEVWSCASFVFDNKTGSLVFGDLDKKLAEDNHDTFVLDDNGIHYVYTRCQNTSEMQFSLAEGELFFNTYLQVLDEFKPDIVFGYCPGMTSMTCFAEAQRRGIATVYLLVNGNHKHFSFPHFDLVITDSVATSKYYAECSNINVVPTGAFFQEENVVSREREPKYVTLINPSFEKGLSIFAKLVSVCKTELPDVKFLVLNSRGVFSQNVTALHEKDNKDVHPFKPEDFSNVDSTGIQKDMRPVYKITKVLVAPSLWFESWGRVTTEAVLNNIPVLSSMSGGIPEAMAGGGISLETPDHCKNDYLSVPTDEEIRPWVDALKRLLNEDWTEALKKAQETLSVEKSTDRVIETLRPFAERKPSNNPMFYRA